MSNQELDHRRGQILFAIALKVPYLELVRACGGLYQCPKDTAGNRLGPLAGFAGTYVSDDGRNLAYVAEDYVDFAMVEEWGAALEKVALDLNKKIEDLECKIDAFCGAPMGGLALASTLAVNRHARYLFPEKKVTAVATPDAREQSELAFGRHVPQPGERVAIVEDVCNNFSTTAKLVQLIEGYGAEVVAVVCFLNRSPTVRELYAVQKGRTLPVIALVNEPLPQYRQDDPFVAADVVAGKVVWKPKLEMELLIEIMRLATK